MTTHTRTSWGGRVAVAAVLLTAVLAGCSDGEATETIPPPTSSDPSSTQPESPSPSGSGPELSLTQELAYKQAVEAVQGAYRVEARVYARGKRDAKAERQLREVMVGRALHLARGGLGVFEKRQWHTEGQSRVDPIKPVKVKPGKPTKDDGQVVFLACVDRSEAWIIGADGKRLEHEGPVRWVSRETVYEHEGAWKLSKSEKKLKKPGDC